MSGANNTAVHLLWQQRFSSTETPYYCAQIPFRRVQLTDGTHFDKYDTTGPQVRLLLVSVLIAASGCQIFVLN